MNVRGKKFLSWMLAVFVAAALAVPYAQPVRAASMNDQQQVVDVQPTDDEEAGSKEAEISTGPEKETDEEGSLEETVSKPASEIKDEPGLDQGSKTERSKNKSAVLAAASVNSTIGSANNASYKQDTMNNLTMAGPYQFNIAGNSNTKGKYNLNTTFGVSHHGDTAAEVVCGKLPNAVGGKGAQNTNSSTAVLVDPRNDNVKIAKAYLVVTATQTVDSITGQTAALEQYGFFFKGPKGTINRYYPSVVYHDSVKCRASSYFDVTDFVKSEGYGTYAGVNIPYTNMNAGVWNVGSDLFGAWKLIVIEENADLPLRMVNMKLGGTSVQSSSPTNVNIQGDGLVVKQKPTGELLFSMDGYDIGDSEQTLQYSTDKNATKKKISEAPLRGANRFFSAQIMNKGKALTANPGPAYAYVLNGSNYLSVAGVNSGQPFQLYNTDFETMYVNAPSNAGSMQLAGGEKSVTMQADTSGAPTLLSALGLAVDIVVPEFESDITVVNLTQSYTTKDADYDKTVNYALPNDRLRVTATCQNTSTSSNNIGIKNSKLAVEVPALLNVDQTTIKGYYIAPSGAKTQLTGKASGTTIVFENNANITMVSGGKFEVSYEGTATSTNTYTEYTNKVTVNGTFVDDSGKHYSSFALDNMGIAYADTASDILKNKLTVTKDGSGSVSGTGRYPYNGSGKAVWKPSSGNYTRLLLIDGQVRDDLVLRGQADIAMKDRDHTAFAAFTKGVRPVKDHYLIATAGDSHVQQLTPSKVVASGDDHTVTWKAEPGYSVSEILVDGYAYPVSDEGSISFRGVLADHTVEIRTVNNYAYVQTIVRGSGEITPSASVRKGDSYAVDWKSINGGILSSITVNGSVVYDELTSTENAPAQYSFTDIQENQLIEVVYRNPDNKPIDQLLVNTQILNGPGTITPSKVVSNNSSMQVSWNPKDGYDVQKIVYYKGSIRQELPVTQNSVNLTNITEDCLVQVFLKGGDEPEQTDLFQINTTLIGGPESITPSQLDVLRGQDRTIQWKAGADYRIESVVIDGEVRDDLTAASEYAFADIDQDHLVIVKVVKNTEPKDDDDFFRIDTSRIGNGSITDSARVNPKSSYTVSWQPADGESVLNVKVDGMERPDLIDAGQVSFIDIQKNHQVEVVFSQDSKQPQTDKLLHVTTDLYGGPGNITPSAAVKEGEDYPVSWSAAEGYHVQTVIVDGKGLDALADQGSQDFSDILENHDVVVILAKGEVETDKLLCVATEKKGEGTITPTTILNRGEDHTVTWKAADGWEVDTVLVDGVIQTKAVAKSGQLEFEDVARNHDVQVVFKKIGEDKPNPQDNQYAVETVITGGIGTITPTSHYKGGETAQVAWNVDPRYDIARIYVDGSLRNDLINAAGVDFEDIGANHKVEVILIPLRPTKMTMEKTARNMTHPDGPNTVNDVIQYSLTATNHTPDSQWDNVVIHDQLPASLTLKEGSIILTGPDGKPQPISGNSYTFDKSSNQLTVKAGTLLAGQSYTVTFEAKINEKAVSASGGVSIKNMALATGTDADGAPLEDIWSQAVIPGPEGSADSIMPLSPSPYVEKQAKRIGGSGDNLRVGDRIRYTIKAENRKAGSLWADVLVQDQLPKGLTPDIATLRVITQDGKRIKPKDYTYKKGARTLTIYVGDIYGPGEVKVQFEAVINESAVKSGIGNTAVAVGYPPDQRPDTPPSSKDALPGGNVIKSKLPGKVYPEGFSKHSDISPQTGDDSIGLWPLIALCILTALIMGTMLYLRRREQQKE